jgi:hypothetical protein
MAGREAIPSHLVQPGFSRGARGLLCLPEHRLDLKFAIKQGPRELGFVLDDAADAVFPFESPTQNLR